MEITFANVSPGVLNSWITIHIGKKTEAKSILVIWGISKTINEDAGRGGLESFSHTII